MGDEDNFQLTNDLRTPSVTMETRSDAQSVTSGTQNVNQDVGLKRQIGLIRGTSIIVGIMIGSGIFVSPSIVAYSSGSVGLSLVTWTICGVISTLGALCQAELGTLVPESGGGYTYLYHAYGPAPAFILAWMTIIALRPAGLSIVGLTCAHYIISPIFTDGCGEPPIFIVKLTTAFLIVSLLAINIHNVRLATNIQVLFTVLKLIAVVIVIIGGIVKMAQGHTEILATGFTGSSHDIGSISIGIYAGMWAYDGWNSLNDVTEEIREPHKNLPRAIIIGVPLVTICYILMNVSYFSVLSPMEVASSPAVAMTWAEKVIPSLPWLLPVCVALSTFGALNGALFIGPRLPYAAGRNGHMVSVLSMIHVTHDSPAVASILTCAMALLLIIPGEISSLLNFFSFAVWMFHAMTASTVIYFRFARKDQHRPIKVPLIIPVIVVLAALFLVVIPLVMKPDMAYLYSFLFIMGGFIFYIPFVHFKIKLSCMDKVTTFLQLLLESSPSTSIKSESKKST